MLLGPGFLDLPGSFVSQYVHEYVLYLEFRRFVARWESGYALTIRDGETLLVRGSHIGAYVK